MGLEAATLIRQGASDEHVGDARRRATKLLPHVRQQTTLEEGLERLADFGVQRLAVFDHPAQESCLVIDRVQRGLLKASLFREGRRAHMADIIGRHQTGKEMKLPGCFIAGERTLLWQSAFHACCGAEL